jgi:hypothetical protein
MVNRLADPWTIVCIAGFLIYAGAGWSHRGDGARPAIFYGLGAISLLLAVVRAARRPKPPVR